MSAIDLDVPASWPARLRRLAGNTVGLPGCTTRCTVDLRPPAQVTAGILDVMSEHGVVVFHCTRLVDEEVADIRAHGLRAASGDLLARKLALAVEGGLLSEEQRVTLQQSTILESRRQGAARANRLCALSIRRTIDLEASGGLRRFLSVWGGEMTYWTHEGDDIWRSLQGVGRPSIVVLDVPISLVKIWAPDAANVVIARWRGLADCAGELQIDLASDQALSIRDVWQPGHVEYDRHGDLPRN